MEFPSLSKIIDTSFSVFKRFPLTMVLSFLGTVLGIYYMELGENTEWAKGGLIGSPWIEPVGGIVMALVTGFILSLAFDLFAESRKFKPENRIFLSGGVLIVMLLIFFLFTENHRSWLESDVILYFFLNLAALILFFLLPFLMRDKLRGFYNFTVDFLVRILKTGFVFGVIYIAFVILLLSLNFLFDEFIDGRIFFYLWIFLAGFLAPLYFLSGIRRPLDNYGKNDVQPKLLDFFVRYVMTPFSVLYLLIVYLYLLKILLSWEWPKGEVAQLIIFFSGIGIGVYFLIYYLKDRFAQLYRKYFFLFLLPLILVLFIAIFIRISDYGVTVDRYLVAASGCLLLGISVYFIFSRKKDLRFIPLAFLVMILISMAGGPVGAFGVSEGSQLNRLEKILVQNGILKDGKVEIGTKHLISQTDYDEIQSIVRYLLNTHNSKELSEWVDKSVFSVSSFVDILGVESKTDSVGSDLKVFKVNDRLLRNEGAGIGGYDRIYELTMIGKNDKYIEEYLFNYENKSFELFIKEDGSGKIIENGSNKLLVEFDFFQLVENLEKNGYLSDYEYNVPSEMLSLEFENDNIKGKFLLTSLYVDYDFGEPIGIDNILGSLLLKLK